MSIMYGMKWYGIYVCVSIFECQFRVSVFVAYM